MPFESLGLAEPLVRGILETGYTAPTKIQSMAIPIALEGGDIIGCAQTGTGKTAAFVLPILNKIAKSEAPSRRQPKALILTPTRELALQIEQSVKGYGRFMKLRSLTVYGGVGYEAQIQSLRRGVDIVIATPGRLGDLMKKRSIDISKIQCLVLDEADRMLDMGFINEVKNIISFTPKNRQTLLFSATMSKQVNALAEDILQNPKLIEVGATQSTADSVTQYFYSINKNYKLDLLTHIINSQELDCVLVFSRTKYGADRITNNLIKRGISSAAIHSARTQKQRETALEGFRKGNFYVLVATDIAARGIDVEGISHVINYDVPNHPEDYVHRIGRTGRASAIGDAITFVSSDEILYLKKIEKYLSKKIKLANYTGFNPNDVKGSHVAAERHEQRLIESGDDYPSGRSNHQRRNPETKQSSRSQENKSNTGKSRKRNFAEQDRQQSGSEKRGSKNSFTDKSNSKRNSKPKKNGNYDSEKTFSSERKFGEKRFGERKFGEKKFGEKRFGERKFGSKLNKGFKKKNFGQS